MFRKLVLRSGSCMFRLNIFYFICMKRDWWYVVCLIAFLVEHILFLQTMQLESLIIQPAFIIYPIYLYYFYKFNESKINHFLLLFAKGELLGGRWSGGVKTCWSWCFLTTLLELFFGGLSARDIPLRFPKMKQAFEGTIGVSELSHPNAQLKFTSHMWIFEKNNSTFWASNKQNK